MATSYATRWSTGDRRLSILDSVVNGSSGSWGAPSNRSGLYDGRGIVAPVSDVSLWLGVSDVCGFGLTFDFLDKMIVDEFKFYQREPNQTVIHPGQGRWYLYGTNDFITVPTLASDFQLGKGTGDPWILSFANTTGYRYYILVGGCFIPPASSDGGPYWQEFEFKCEPEQGLATSYLYPYGEGDRTGSVNVTCSPCLPKTGHHIEYLINGELGSNNVYAVPLYAPNPPDPGNTVEFNSLPAANLFIKFEFPTPRCITELFMWSIGGGTTDHGVWKLQGSNDDRYWFDIGGTFNWKYDTGSQPLGTGGGYAAAYQIVTTPSANTEVWKFYRLLGVSGNTNSAAGNTKILFKIGDGSVSGTPNIVVTQAGLEVWRRAGSSSGNPGKTYGFLGL